MEVSLSRLLMKMEVSSTSTEQTLLITCPQLLKISPMEMSDNKVKLATSNFLLKVILKHYNL